MNELDNITDPTGGHPHKKYWFRARSFGWGWTPSSWQGWLVTLVYLALLTAGVIELSYHAAQLPVSQAKPQSIPAFVWGWIIYYIALTAILMVISYRTGEKPKWCWGRRSNMNNNANMNNDERENHES
jgi:hypothetical protein